MIFIKTKLRKIPDVCTNCKYSDVLRYSFGSDSTRYCRITGTETPMAKTVAGNMKYGKPKNCPLVETEEGDGCR